MGYYNQSNQRESKPTPCKYCGVAIVRWGKKADGKPAKYSLDGSGIEVYHDYDTICKPNQPHRQQNIEIFNQMYSQTPTQQVTQQQPQQTLSTTASTAASPIPANLTNDLSILKQLVSGIKLKTDRITDIEKRLDTMAELVDGIYQKIELIVEKVGYPEPKPVLEIPSEVQQQQPVHEPEPEKVVTLTEHNKKEKIKAIQMAANQGYEYHKIENAPPVTCSVCQQNVFEFYHPEIPDDNYDQSAMMCEPCFFGNMQEQ